MNTFSSRFPSVTLAAFVFAVLFGGCGAQESRPSASDPPFQLDLDDAPSPESIERIRGADRRPIGRVREAARFRQPEDDSFIEIVGTQVEPRSGRLFGTDHNTAHIYELAPDLTIRQRLLSAEEAEPVRQFGDFKLGFTGGRFILMSGNVAFQAGRLVYVPTFIPIFYIVDLSAETMRVYPTMDYLAFDQQDEPEAETSESGMAVMRPPERRASSLRFVSADTAFVMSTFTRTEERTWLDAYLMTSGEYVGSIELNANVRSMSGGPTSIMVSTQEGELIRFDRQMGAGASDN